MIWTAPTRGGPEFRSLGLFWLSSAPPFRRFAGSREAHSRPPSPFFVFFSPASGCVAPSSALGWSGPVPWPPTRSPTSASSLPNSWSASRRAPSSWTRSRAAPPRPPTTCSSWAVERPELVAPSTPQLGTLDVPPGLPFCGRCVFFPGLRFPLVPMSATPSLLGRRPSRWAVALSPPPPSPLSSPPRLADVPFALLLRSGLKVALVEREDFAAGTSSRSTKLVHGGVRYLEKVRGLRSGGA